MELIPILSTIILVATISTFILAVGAYILYKVQEKKADQYARKEVEQEQAELLEPADFGGRKLIIEEPKEKQVFEQHHYHPVETAVKETKINRTYQEKERKRVKRQPTEPKFLKFTSEGYVETRKDQDAGVISWQ
jgi:Na+-transporting NADH:ubiquinone oxidoreductase subunit NqrC